MKFIVLLLLCISILCSCSEKRENTYEDNLAICTIKLSRSLKKTAKTGLARAQAEENVRSQIRECMKGSRGPNYVVKTFGGDSVSTVPSRGKAMVLFFWAVTDSFAPASFKKSDVATIKGMNALYHKYGHSVDFLGFPFSEHTAVKHYLQRYPLDFPQIDDKRVNSKRHMSLTQNIHPYVIFINTQGNVVKIQSGGYTTEGKTVERYSPVIQACMENKPYEK